MKGIFLFLDFKQEFDEKYGNKKQHCATAVLLLTITKKLSTEIKMIEQPFALVLALV